MFCRFGTWSVSYRIPSQQENLEQPFSQTLFQLLSSRWYNNNSTVNSSSKHIRQNDEQKINEYKKEIFVLCILWMGLQCKVVFCLE